MSAPPVNSILPFGNTTFYPSCVFSVPPVIVLLVIYVPALYFVHSLTVCLSGYLCDCKLVRKSTGFVISLTGLRSTMYLRVGCFNARSGYTKRQPIMTKVDFIICSVTHLSIMYPLGCSTDVSGTQMEDSVRYLCCHLVRFLRTFLQSLVFRLMRESINGD